MERQTSASVTSSTINFSKGIIGSSLLVMPSAFANTGLLLGIILYIFCACVHSIGLHLVSLCVLQARAKGKEASFVSLAQTAFGGKAAIALVATSVIVCSYGTAVGVLLITGHALPEISVFLGAEGGPLTSSSCWITAIGWCVTLPPCFLEKLDSLKFVSFIGNMANLYLIIVLLLFASGIFSLPPIEHSLTFWPPPETQYTSKEGIVQAFSLFMFSLISTTSMPTVVQELEDPTIGRVDAVIVFSNLIVTFIYMSVGINGAVAFGASVDVDVLNSFPNEHGASGSAAILARVVVVLAVLPMVPIWMHPLRAAVSEVFLGKPQSELKKSTRAGVTLLLFMMLWITAVAFDNLDEVLALTGASSQIMNGFVFPALFYLLAYLGVSARGDDDSGIDLAFSNAEAVPDAPVQSFRGTSNLAKPAWAMAVAGMIFMPLAVGVEFWKILSKL